MTPMVQHSKSDQALNGKMKAGHFYGLNLTKVTLVYSLFISNHRIFSIKASMGNI